MLDWLDWTVFLGFVAGYATLKAARSWRELGILVVLAALLVYPVMWIGPGPGFAAVSPKAVSAAVILGSIVLIVWKARKGRRDVWIVLWAISQLLLTLLTGLLHLATVLMAPAGAAGLVATFLLPGIAQLYWISALWPGTASLSHPLTRMCVLWLCVVAIWLLARAMSGGRREPV